MLTHPLQIVPRDIVARTVIVVASDFRRRRAIEFIGRMAGFETCGVEHDLEAANWLLTMPVERHAALVLVSPLDARSRKTLQAIIPSQVRLPVICVISSHRNQEKDSREYSGCENWCVTCTEDRLLEILKNNCHRESSEAKPDVVVEKEHKDDEFNRGNLPEADRDRGQY